MTNASRSAARQETRCLSGAVNSLTVFFPAYQDEHTIGQLVTECLELLQKKVPDHEVIVINDGSTDNTARVLDELQHVYGSHRLRIVTHPRNQGYGAALRSGFALASKDFVFYTDGDGQYDVADLLALLPHARCGWVNGVKIGRADAAHRKWIGGLYNQFARALFQLQLRDIDCDFRLIRRNALDVTQFRSTSGTICIEIVRQLESAGLRAVEVPVKHLARRHGRSQFFRLVPLTRTLVQILALYWHSVLGSGKLRGDRGAGNTIPAAELK